MYEQLELKDSHQSRMTSERTSSPSLSLMHFYLIQIANVILIVNADSLSPTALSEEIKLLCEKHEQRCAQD